MECEVFLDPLDFLRDLYERDLPYLLVGRQALVLLGAPLMTADYDFCFSPERDPLDRLLSLSESRGLEASASNVFERPFFSLLGDTIKLDFFRCRTYTTKGGDTFTFDDLYLRKQMIAVSDFAVTIPTIEDLIRIKQVRNSPKDLEDIKYLQVLAERM